ncbi:hypothetical protein AB0M86_48080 [Streptomyces sp. NPDC051639]|uniref:hypothetical protein n=1 Tax=Streptomyces sp. NPDC051639 TaxID=3155671 RepID=UPI0034140393
MTPEEERDNALNELARLRAGLAAGLTPEQSARLNGATPEELQADATAFAAELGAANPAGSAPRSGGNQGPDVVTVGAVAAGAALYRAKHGLDDDGRRPERRPVTNDGGNPFRENGYSMG